LPTTINARYGATVISWLGAQFNAVKGLMVDEIVSEIAIESSVGKALCWCQLRRRKSSSETYVVIKSKGGDATVWVPIELSEARKLAAYLEQITADAEPLAKPPSSL
jgi:CelD/BcsL family acetyltransferase involved in cellulose biosynthesis